ncbi:MAG TPA: hypothetical protein VHY08_23440 [Bacillota bacterium]|nr:hypothetical protein [Bacillota bacterium]
MNTRNKVLNLAFICITILLLSFTTFAELSLDSAILQINVSGQTDYGTFKAQMTLSYNISENKVDDFYVSMKMAPGDIFMVFEVASISKISVDKVVEVYKVDKKKGWGVMAKELGIKPGSKEFKQLKNSANGFYEKLKSKGANSGGASSGGGNSGDANSGGGNKKGGKK